MITIALAQMNIAIGQPKVNLARARDLAAQAQQAEADLLLLPELWLHGYDLKRVGEWATPLEEGGFADMASLAETFNLHLAGSILERHSGGISNTAALFAPDGERLGSYRKVHLFRPMKEHHHLVPGDSITLCDTPWGMTGLAICYDLRFPELFRTMALEGAMLFLVPAQWPEPRIDAWLYLARARAVENELFVAACNRVGSQKNTTFPGNSLVVDPWGHALAEGDDQERLLIAEIDLEEIHKVRRFLTVYEDRRPEVYRLDV